MKKLTVKMKTVLKMSTVIMLAIVLFLDEDMLNSLVLDYNDELVIKEVASSVVNKESTGSQLTGQVVVNNTEAVNNYSDVSKLSNKASSDYWAWVWI